MHFISHVLIIILCRLLSEAQQNTWRHREGCLRTCKQTFAFEILIVVEFFLNFQHFGFGIFF